MNERCDICIDPRCDGRMDCDCAACAKRDCCYRVLRPTIRITRKCTQRCLHCCYSCSPQLTTHMTVEMARDVATFLRANRITTYANIMGGEFWLCPDWESVLHELLTPLSVSRLVTNGDWAKRRGVTNKVVAFVTAHPQLYVSISKDRWHTNTYVKRAAEILHDAKVPYKLQGDDDDNSIVPVGRGEFHHGVYSFLQTWCSKPERMYEPFIDERGLIYRCGFGVWDYATVQKHLAGGFAACFKEFGLEFNKVFGTNCLRCSQAYARAKSKERRAESPSCSET